MSTLSRQVVKIVPNLVNIVFECAPDRDPFDNHVAPRTNPHPKSFGTDPWLDVAALMAQAATMEEYCPQAILKLCLHNSFNYRVCKEPQPRNILMLILSLEFMIIV